MAASVTRRFTGGAPTCGLQVFKAQRQRELEYENAKRQRLLAEAHLGMHAPIRVLG